MDERWSWLVAGLIFGFLVAAIWTGTPQRPLWLIVLPLVAAPAMLLGSSIGKVAFAAVVQPAEQRHAAIVLAGIGVPFLVGMIDLYLRFTTP